MCLFPEVGTCAFVSLIFKNKTCYVMVSCGAACLQLVNELAPRGGHLRYFSLIFKNELWPSVIIGTYTLMSSLFIKKILLLIQKF